MSQIIHKLESKLPPQCETGAGRLHVVRGYCFHPQKRTTGLALTVGEQGWPVEEFEDFRPDVAQEYSDRDEAGASVTSGFFATFQALPRFAGSELPVALAVTFDDGSVASIDLGRIRFVAPAPRAAEVPAARLVICLATWNPEPAAFARQVDTLIAQDFSDWVCIVNDDCSARTIYAMIRDICARDRRFHLFRNERNLGFYRNFETALGRVPAGAEYVALCDQDDVWNRDKLSASVASFKAGTQLVYCDMRIVDEAGGVIAPTYWSRRRNQYRDLQVLMAANTVTGAASVFRAGLIARLLPFPERIGDCFHDHWIACCALAGGGIEYIDRSLYDYVQHDANAIGHCDFDDTPTPTRQLWQALTRPGGLRRKLALLRYPALAIVDTEYRRLRLIAETLCLRIADRPDLRRELAPYLAVNPWGVALALRHFSPGFSRDTTGGAEMRLASALAIRRLNQFYVRRRAAGIVARIRSVGVGGGNGTERVVRERLNTLADKIAPIKLDIDPAAPRRINMLIPEINKQVFFGGYMGKFNLARKLAENGYRVRMVIVDWCDVQPAEWRALVNRYEGLAGFFNYIEVAYCYDRGQALTVNPDDRFIASTWWTAHIAGDALRQLSQSHHAASASRDFVYLIQEYEPFTFAMGTQYAVAHQSYSFPHRAIFSSGLLEEFFRERALGVFAPGGSGGAAAVYFENAILRFDVVRDEMASRRQRRLLFYARPEGHASRNMFEVGMLALEQAVANGAFAETAWEFHGIGSTPGIMELASGGRLDVLGKLSLDEYQALLPHYDLGLSLMYTPHPSLVPLEMAAAGMLVVTNTCLNKTAEKLTAISTNLIAAEPTIDGVAAALADAARRTSDIDERIRGSSVNWATDWDAAFHPDLMQRLGAWLGPAEGSRG